MSVFLFWILAILPALLYPLLLWAYARRFDQRKELIRSLLTNSNAIPQYSRAFRASSELHSEEWKRRLDLDLESYLYPTSLCSLFTIAAMVAIISVTTQNALRLPHGLFEYAHHTPAAALAGFGGAYVWALYDFTDRFRILNLPTNALHGMWFRMLLTPIVAIFAGSVVKADFAMMMGFAIGMLPVATIVSWVQENARQKLSIAQGKNVEPMWEYIQGLTPDIVARLVEAGVTSACHLANQDPVNLLRRTNIEWRNVLDMMDQAFLLQYVGPPVERLRVMGIRGAIEAAILYKRLMEENAAATSGAASSVLSAMAETLATTPPVTQNLLRNLWEDPQVELIWSLWYDRAAAPSPSDQQVNPEAVDNEQRRAA